MNVALFMLAGCASQTGVVPTGADSYMVSRQDNNFTAAVGTLKAANMREASEFCGKKGQAFTVQNSEDIPRALGKIPQSTLYFKCS
jgi:uncharacterized lipoprotein YajG